MDPRAGKPGAWCYVRASTGRVCLVLLSVHITCAHDLVSPMPLCLQASKARTKGVEARRKEQRGMAERLQQLETGKIMIPPGPRLGDRVLSAQGLRKSYEGRVLFDGVSFELVRCCVHTRSRAVLASYMHTCRLSLLALIPSITQPPPTTGARRHRRGHRRQRLREDDALQRALGESGARRGHGRAGADGEAGARLAAPRRAGRQQDGVPGDCAVGGFHHGAFYSWLVGWLVSEWYLCWGGNEEGPVVWCCGFLLCSC